LSTLFLYWALHIRPQCTTSIARDKQTVPQSAVVDHTTMPSAVDFTFARHTFVVLSGFSQIRHSKTSPILARRTIPESHAKPRVNGVARTARRNTLVIVRKFAPRTLGVTQPVLPSLIARQPIRCTPAAASRTGPLTSSTNSPDWRGAQAGSHERSYYL